MNAFRRRSGPLTQELVLRPGDFGLGNVPARLRPRADRLPQGLGGAGTAPRA